MPHIIADYSANLDDLIDIAGFCERLRQTAVGIEAFPMPGVRVRALRADHYAIADGGPQHGYIDISVRLRGGRSDEVKAEIAETIFAAARDYLSDHLAVHSLALSLELRDIDPELSPKYGTIRDHLGSHS